MPLETYFRHWITLGLPGEASLLLYAEPEHGGYKGRTGLSPPVAYPSTVGNKANESNV
jgi:hypothetical protein